MKETTAIKFRDTSAAIEHALAVSSNSGVCFSGGKKSILLLYLIRRQRLKIKVFFVDSGDEFPEILAFIQKVQKLWGLDLVIVKLDKHTENDFVNESHSKAVHRHIQELAERDHVDGLFLGFTSRADAISEGYFDRNGIVTPLVSWTDDDILDCIQSFNLPLCSLYSRGYRKVDSISSSTAEPLDIAEDLKNEKIIREQLRKLGYL